VSDFKTQRAMMKQFRTLDKVKRQRYAARARAKGVAIEIYFMKRLIKNQERDKLKVRLQREDKAARKGEERARIRDAKRKEGGSEVQDEGQVEGQTGDVVMLE